MALAQPHLLLVEDDREISALVSRYLKGNDIRVSLAANGRDMDRVLAVSRIDLILLDIMLPGEDGLSICRRLRSTLQTPIIIISARGDEVDRVVGLEVGADDYIAKPFGSRELLARIRAVLRRSGRSNVQPAQHRRFCFNGWSLDRTERRLIDADGAHVLLTAAEIDLLIVFCERPGTVLSRDQLLDLTQGRSAGPFERSIDILVSRLRRKLGQGDDGPEIIRTIRSGGYLLVPAVTGE